MTRRLISLTGTALMALSAIFADGSSYQSAQGNDASTSPCCQSRQVTPPALCVNDCAIGMEIDAAFILWTARQPNLEYVATSTAINGSAVFTQGTMSQPDFNLKPGFKVGLGVQTMHDNMEVHVGYTWFQSTDANAVTDVDNTVTSAYPLWNLGIFQDAISGATYTINSATNHYSVKFNALDGVWDRAFWISEWLQFTPSLGIKGAWINQHNDVTYEVTNTGADYYYKSENSCRFRGAGIRAGLNTGWYFTRCWSLQGLLAFSGVYGKYTSNTTSTRAAYATPTEVALTYQDTTDNFYQVAPVMELNLMLQWETFFGDNSEYRFLLNAGWEEQVWFAQNYFTDVYGRAMGSNLSLQGFTLGARFDF